MWWVGRYGCCASCPTIGMGAFGPRPLGGFSPLWCLFGFRFLVYVGRRNFLVPPGGTLKPFIIKAWFWVSFFAIKVKFIIRCTVQRIFMCAQNFAITGWCWKFVRYNEN